MAYHNDNNGKNYLALLCARNSSTQMCYYYPYFTDKKQTEKTVLWHKLKCGRMEAASFNVSCRNPYFSL